jgi:hypothetical protein
MTGNMTEDMTRDIIDDVTGGMWWTCGGYDWGYEW